MKLLNRQGSTRDGGLAEGESRSKAPKENYGRE